MRGFSRGRGCALKSRSSKFIVPTQEKVDLAGQDVILLFNRDIDFGLDNSLYLLPVLTKIVHHLVEGLFFLSLPDGAKPPVYQMMKIKVERNP